MTDRIENWELDKSLLRDDKGRYITQGLFLEVQYKTEFAMYTLDGEDKVYKGKLYPSLKRLYIELGDPTEYKFANQYLYDWKHWKRLQGNKVLNNHIEEWREELALSLQADGIETIITAAMDGNSYQAGKWLNDRGWKKREAGRPSNEDVEEERIKQARILEEYSDDFNLIPISGVNKNGK